MERAEKIGLGIASAGHVLLFAALSTSWLSADPLKLRNQPIEVSFTDEVALQSAARKIAQEPPPPAPGDIEGPPEQAQPTPSQTLAIPEPPAAAPTPAPAPKPESKPRQAKTEPKAPAKRAPSKAEATKSRGMLKLDTSEWANSDSRAEGRKASEGAPAATIGPAQKSALDAEIRRQLKPHWKAPSGADAELLRTIVTVRLARDGSIIGSPEVEDTLGTTASNSVQVRLHQEQAVKAIRLAAPFRLPPDLYSGWSYLRLTFDKRLSQ